MYLYSSPKIQYLAFKFSKKKNHRKLLITSYCSFSYINLFPYISFFQSDNSNEAEIKITQYLMKIPPTISMAESKICQKINIPF